MIEFPCYLSSNILILAHHMRALIAVLLSFVTVAHAEDGGLLSGLISAPLLLPVSIAGNDVMLDSYVIRPDRPGRFPLVIMTGGTPSTDSPEQLARRSPIAFNRAAIALTQRGYATITVMRRGFGLSGGGYSEKMQQACDYLPAVRNSGDDILAAITALRREPWVDPDHILLLGQSTGGLAVLAAAAANPSGVVGLLNFDGGRHSRSTTGEPCSSDHLIDTVAVFGRAARLPALWLYAENDRSYGPSLAQDMVMAYTSGGAPARLLLLAPFDMDGHDLLYNAPPETWLPAAESFLAELKLPTAQVITLPEPAKPLPPGGPSICQEGFAAYLAYRNDAKAFATNQGGACGVGRGRTAHEALVEAISECQSMARGAGTCQIYAVGQHVVGY
jgi:dienelactone hydrolase